MGLQVTGEPEAAEALGEVHPGQAGVPPGAQELGAPGGGGVVGLEQGGDALLEVAAVLLAHEVACVCLRISALARAFLCTSSGPSAKRSVRIEA